ncbi:MAG: AMP-binding protein [Acidimicrobiia bacterium]|nr:AMP-binding protein [Acidimicrobiia bacterium]
MDLRSVPISLRTLGRSGLLRPQNPLRLLGAARALRHWGPTMAAGFAAAAAQHPHRRCLTDERGAMTWSQVEEASNAIAHGLAERGVQPGSVVGTMCRNHRGFVLATAALAKLGAVTVYLNTGFAGPQLTEVLGREGATALITDEEFLPLLDGGSEVDLVVVSWLDDPTITSSSHLTLDALADRGQAAPPEPPPKPGRTVILTSGTTGTPKGAPRDQHSGLGAAVSMLERIPYRAGETVVLPAPMFHSWGLGNLTIGLALGNSFVLRRRFDPESVLADVAAHRAEVLVAVPVMLQRILDLGPEVHARYDTSSLRVVPLSGSAIPAGLATRWMDAFGDNLYNLYGSTEVGWATIATPEDLRADPTTAGRPPLHTVVKLLDADGHEVPQGASGRIFVGSELMFEGYTGGGGKEIIDGLMSTGDTGRFDEHGRLHVEGRDDEMIVSGGENVFPREVEDLLSELDDVVEVAVIGVDDEEFGQRLKAVVVRREGSALDEDAVRAHVRANLASYKVPRDVVFTEELPRNPTGKVLKRNL